MAMYTLEQLNDLECIRRLRVLYSHYYDGQDLDALCSLFTKDALCRFGAGHGGDWNCLPAIRANYAAWFEKFPGSFSVLHAVTNHWVELTGPVSATGRAFLLDYNFHRPQRPTPLGTVGVYDDVYAKTESGWKFQRMSLDFLWPDREILSWPPR